MSMPACIIVVFSLHLIVIDNISSCTNRITIGIVDGASTTTTSSSVTRRRGLFGRRTNHEDLIHTPDDDDEYDEYSYDRFNNNFFNKNNDDNDPTKVEDEEECVTSFYTRVRAKRRALLNGPQFDSSSQLHLKPLSDDNDDIVSLTSTHCPLSSSRGVSPQGAMMDDNIHSHHRQLFDVSLVDTNLSSDGGDSTMARSVRGGGGSSSATTARRHASRSTTTSSSFWGMRPQDNTDRRNSRSSCRSSTYFHNSLANNDNIMDQEDSCFPPQEKEDELMNINESFQDNYHTNEDYHQHHCLGLLRVPCSIAINSGEESSSSSSQQYHHHHVKTTSVSAYVDTGAQVTVISAAAAKRAGIYHLMDRRYAGRATGVGHCRVLGRIPARHVYFLLGGNEDKQDDDDDDWRDVRGGGGSNTSYDPQDKSNSSKNVMVQMDGPALTVLEGTVTKGVDVLLGLDVLQDWEAEIRMGSNKSITVREKKRRGGAFVVIPFATSSNKDGASLRSSGGVYTARSSSSSRTSFYNHLDHPRRHSNSKANMYYATVDNDNDGMDLIEDDMDLINSDIVEGLEEDYDEDTDDYDDLFFSPTSTDIESDLDLLDKSGHEFPLYDAISSGSSRRRSQTSSRSSFFSGGDRAASNDDTNKIRRTKMTVHDEQEDKLSATIVRCGDGGKHIPSIIQDEKYELDDMNDDVDYDFEEKIDMSGL